MRARATLLPFALMVMTITTVPTLILDEQGLPRYRSLRQELHRLRDTNQQLVRKIVILKNQVNALRTNPHYVEKIARDELTMVRPQEYVFQFPRER